MKAKNKTNLKKKWLNFGKIILIVIATIFILGILLIKSLDLLMNRYSEKIFSPDRVYYVEVSETNGGATTGYISGVTITNTKSLLSYSRYLSGRSNNSNSIFASNGANSSIHTSWLDNRTLKVSFSDCTKIYGQDKVWKDIKIIYEGECKMDNIDNH